jgi:uncharacterized protein (UPF0276 family)
MIHGIPVRTASSNLRDYDFSELNSYLAKYKCPHFGVHLRASEDDFTQKLKQKQIKQHVESDLKFFKNNIKVPLLIENMPSYAAIDGFTDPLYLNKVCDKFDLGLLLDLSHAKITAYYMGIPFEEYINALPLRRVREIHVNGTFLDPELGIRDKHYEMDATDYDNLSYVLAITHAKYLTLEYGGIGECMKDRSNKYAIKKQLLHLQTIIR